MEQEVAVQATQEHMEQLTAAIAKMKGAKAATEAQTAVPTHMADTGPGSSRSTLCLGQPLSAMVSASMPGSPTVAAVLAVDEDGEDEGKPLGMAGSEVTSEGLQPGFSGELMTVPRTAGETIAEDEDEE